MAMSTVGRQTVFGGRIDNLPPFPFAQESTPIIHGTINGINRGPNSLPQIPAQKVPHNRPIPHLLDSPRLPFIIAFFLELADLAWRLPRRKTVSSSRSKTHVKLHSHNPA